MLRFVEENDIPALLEAERLFNTVIIEDADFGTLQVLNDWALTEKEILEGIQQIPNREEGVCDTRTFIIENQSAELTGGFCFEIQETWFEVLYFILSPGHAEEAFWEMLAFLQARADRASKRRKVILYVRDRDEAGLRTLLPCLLKASWKVSLVANHFGSTDAWRGVYEAPSE